MTLNGSDDLVTYIFILRIILCDLQLQQTAIGLLYTTRNIKRQRAASSSSIYVYTTTCGMWPRCDAQTAAHDTGGGQPARAGP